MFWLFGFYNQYVYYVKEFKESRQTGIYNGTISETLPSAGTFDELHIEAGLVCVQDGNPFGPFWDHLGVDFDRSVPFGGLSFGSYYIPHWMKRYESAEAE